MWIGVLWAGLQAAMWITHVGGKISSWPARKVTEILEDKERKSEHIGRNQANRNKLVQMGATIFRWPQTWGSKTSQDPPQSLGRSGQLVRLSPAASTSPPKLRSHPPATEPLCLVGGISEIPPVLLGIPWPPLKGPLRYQFWKKEASPAVLGGREFWKRSGSLKCLEL